MTSSGQPRHDWIIEPTGRLGPIHLGSTRVAVVDALGHPVRSRQSEPLEFLEYGDLTVMLNSGVVSMVVANEGYRGATSQGLRPGMAVLDAERIVGSFWYDSAESLWRFVGGEHLAVEIVRAPREGETPIDGEAVAEAYRLSDPRLAVIRRIYLVDSFAA